MSETHRQTCYVCGQEFATADLAQFGAQFVCAGCKPLYAQRLREGLTPLPAGAAGEFADETIPELRRGALSLGALFAVAWGVCARRFGLLLGLQLTVTLPFAIVALALKIRAATQPDAAQALERSVALLGVPQGLLSLVIFGACLAVIARDTAGRQPAYGAALAHGLSRWGWLLWSALCVGVLVVLGCVLLIVPGIVLLGYYLFVTESAVLTTARGAGALAYSMALVRGRWWTVVGYHLLLASICYLPILGLAFLSGVLAGHFGARGHLVFATFEILIQQVFILPFTAFHTVFTGVFFLNLHRSRLAQPSYYAKQPNGAADDPGLLAP